MLVLTRKEGQWVEVTHRPSGDVLRLRVYGFEDGGVRLAFDAPYEQFRVLRSELAGHHEGGRRE